MSETIDLSTMTASEIDDLKNKKELELQEASDALEKAQEESHRLKKEMISLRGQQQDIEAKIDKGRHVMRVINSELRRITSAYFRALRGQP